LFPGVQSKWSDKIAYDVAPDKVNSYGVMILIVGLLAEMDTLIVPKACWVNKAVINTNTHKKCVTSNLNFLSTLWLGLV